MIVNVNGSLAEDPALLVDCLGLAEGFRANPPGTDVLPMPRYKIQLPRSRNHFLTTVSTTLTQLYNGPKIHPHVRFGDDSTRRHDRLSFASMVSNQSFLEAILMDMTSALRITFWNKGRY